MGEALQIHGEFLLKVYTKDFQAATYDSVMPMIADDIIRLIQDGIEGAEVEIIDLAGDGDHYEAIVTAEAFRGLPRIQQHQMVYLALGGRMGGELHALKLKTQAP